MAGTGIRSRRQKLVEGMERSLSDLLHERMDRSLRDSNTNRRPPDNTSALYIWASNQAPDMLNQLYSIHLEALKERGEIPRKEHRVPSSDAQRKRMLSAVRACVSRTRR
ncbi:MAG: hypothetical protein ABFS37_10345 [Acidobacteriota bacterium]